MQAKSTMNVEAQCRRRRHRGYIQAMIACAIALTAVLGCTPRPALQFSPATLPDAQVGSAYAATITVSQAVTPVGGASVQDGTLPAGLDLTLTMEPADTIQISGTPTVSGTFSFRSEERRVGKECRSRWS